MAPHTHVEGAPRRMEDEQAMIRLRRFATLLDSSIPLPFGYRIGLDGVIGLIPGVGDAIGAGLSSFIILKAAQLGAPGLLIARMIFNVLVETVIGMVPVLGDIFDFAWKANLRNLNLLESQLYGAPYQNPTDKRVVAWVLLVLAVLLALLLLSLWFVIQLFKVLL